MRSSSKNPCGLTYRQCELMDALVRLGSVRAIAAEEKQNAKTIRNTLRAAFDKLGCETDVHAVLKWDRMRRQVTEFYGKRNANSVFSLAANEQERTAA